ncbi:MAG: Uma2 family endonuclease [Cyanobacteria bacterium SBLK]|nr:Uma2 family endonuclease [Cyanobacteria bacterium SBLK]
MTLAPLKTPIIYPEPDGEPMAESDPARDYLVYGVESLKFYFREREDVYVSGNLWISYERGVPDAAVSPDVFVVFGVGNRPRRSFRVWEEGGRTPDWVLEVTSAKTWKKDEEQKPTIYAQLGVSEYFQYDPTGDYLDPSLKGQHLVNGIYQLLTPNTLEDGSRSLYSEVLGLYLRLLPNGQLRFFNPQTGEYLRNFDESEQRANQQQQRAEQAETALQETQTALQQLRDRLVAMGLDPDNLPS